jgi:hypothetical protein
MQYVLVSAFIWNYINKMSNARNMPTVEIKTGFLLPFGGQPKNQVVGREIRLSTYDFL